MSRGARLRVVGPTLRWAWTRPHQPPALIRRPRSTSFTRSQQRWWHARDDGSSYTGGGGLPSHEEDKKAKVGVNGEADDERWVKSYGLSGRGKGNATRVVARGHVIETDVPRSMGGADGAPQPVELLLAALVQATAAYVARNMTPRFPLRGVTFEYRGFRDSRGATWLPLHVSPPAPARLTRVTGVATVHLSPRAACPEPAERVDELRRLVEARCPVANMLEAAGCRLDIEWRAARDRDMFDE